MTNNIRKIYINSKDRNAAMSNSSTDFIIDLPKSINISGQKILVDSIEFPNTFYSIDDYNKNIYLEMYEFDDPTNTNFFIIQLPKTLNIDIIILAQILQTSLNNATDNVNKTNMFNTLYNINNNTIEIKAMYSDIHFKIWSNYELITYKIQWFGPVYNTSSLNSYNNNLTIHGTTPHFDFSTPFLSAYIIFNTIESAYLITDIIESDTILNNRLSPILVKIPINANKNELVQMNNNNLVDSAQINSLTTSALSFKLIDSNYNVINLNGGNLKFSILFFNI